METCNGCVHLVSMPDGEKQLQTVCTRNPPTVFVLMVQTMAGVRPSVSAAYPPVPVNFPACAEYMTGEEVEAPPGANDSGEIEY